MTVTNTVGGGVPDVPEKKRQQEKAAIGLMIELYCRGHHGTPKGRLCPDCAVLRDYAGARAGPTYPSTGGRRQRPWASPHPWATPWTASATGTTRWSF